MPRSLSFHEFVELTNGFRMKDLLSLRRRFKSGKMASQIVQGRLVDRRDDALLLLRPGHVDDVPSVSSQVILQLASTRLRIAAEIAIKGGHAPGFTVDFLCGFREILPNCDHQQAQCDPVKHGDCAEVEAHNVIVRQLRMMERRHPSPGYDHPPDPEHAEY